MAIQNLHHCAGIRSRHQENAGRAKILEVMPRAQEQTKLIASTCVRTYLQ
jgi:hypothetical protein